MAQLTAVFIAIIKVCCGAESEPAYDFYSRLNELSDLVGSLRTVYRCVAVLVSNLIACRARRRPGRGRHRAE